MKTGRPTTFTAHCRVWRLLLDASIPLELRDVADRACIAENYAYAVLKSLRECGLVHIASWRQVPGYPRAQWACGFSDDAPRPRREDEKSRRTRSWHLVKAAFVAEHGIKAWRKRALSRALGGADRIVRDGRTIYQRGPAPARRSAP